MKKMIISVSVLVFVLGMAFPLRAEDGSSAEVLKKLNEISDGQKQIMDSLEQMKSELQIIKVRTTR